MAGIVKAAAVRSQGGAGAVGSVIIDNTVTVKTVAPPVLQEPEEGTAADTAALAEAENARRESINAETERIKQYYREEGEKALAEAKKRAEQILSDTEKQAAQYAEAAKSQAEEIFAKAQQDGFEKGHDDGYKKGLMKCKDMLLELKSASERINAEKEELFESYETEIFDTVMEIVNRVTLNSLGQKDKAVIKKTVKEAGKAFRNSDYVKLTLSKTDISEEMAADADYFKKLFTNVKTVEVEILKDAPSGTVILDNGSETIDAGIQTQLKMIEELGKGKYRRAPSKRAKKTAEKPDGEAAEVKAAVAQADTVAAEDEPAPQEKE